MLPDSFQYVLRKWTGTMRHKEAAEKLDVPLWTFRGWWYGKTRPARTCMTCLLAKMGVK